jgi:citrate lyase subunit beta/citryl-CoA lyase
MVDQMRTMLFCPASEPKMYINAPIYRPDCIIFDLEDSVAYNEKDAARDLLCEAIKALDFNGSEIYVRINQLSTGIGVQDVKSVIKAGIKNIRLPMCESADNVKELEELVDRVEREYGLPEGITKFQCAIETTKGVLNAMEIATASKRVTSISFGAEDFTNIMGTERSKSKIELQYARTYIPIVAASVGIKSIDTVWSDVRDMEGFREEVAEAKQLGFTGKSCIHPNQVMEVHKIYNPSEKEIKLARQVIEASREAERKGMGVTVFNGRMIDKPIIEKAEKILNRSEQECRHAI